MTIDKIIDAMKEAFYFSVSDEVINEIKAFVHNPEHELMITPETEISSLFVQWFFQHDKDEVQASDTEITRYVTAIIKLSDDEGWKHRLSMSRVLPLFPQFFDELYPKFDYMLDALEASYDSDKTDLLCAFSEAFSHQEVLDFITSEVPKADGFYRYEYNLYTWYILRPILVKAFDSGDAGKLNNAIVTYCDALLQDYLDVNYFQTSRYSTSVVPDQRTSFSEVGRAAFLAVLNQTGDQEACIEQVRSELHLKPLYKNDRVAYTLLEADKEFQWLFSILSKHSDEPVIVQSSVAQQLLTMVYQLDPQFYISTFHFKEHYQYCCWQEASPVIEECVALGAAMPERQGDYISYVLLYALEHYTCQAFGLYQEGEADRYAKDNTHVQIMQQLVARFGADEVVRNLKPRSEVELELGLSLLEEIIGSPLAKKQEKEQQNLDLIAQRLSVKEGDSTVLAHYFYSGEGVEKAQKCKVNPEAYLGDLSFLSDDYFTRVAHVVLHSKKAKLVQQLVTSGKQIRALYLNQRIAHVIFSEPSYIPLFIQAYGIELREFMSLNERFNHKGAFAVDDAYFSQDPYQREMKWLQENGIPLISGSIKFKAVEREALLTRMAGQITTQDEALALLTALKAKQKGVVASALTAIIALPIELLDAVLATLTQDLAAYSGTNQVAAVEAICAKPMEKERAIELLGLLTDGHARSLLCKHVQLDITELYINEVGGFDIEAYLADSYVEPKKFEINYAQFDVPLLVNTHSAKEALTQLFLIMQSDDSFTENKEAKAIISSIDEASLQAFFVQLIEAFASKTTAKNRWILQVVGMFGHDTVQTHLAKAITTLANGSKNMVAAFLIKAMALSGQHRAYMEIDRIARGCKKQSVKDAAVDAFEMGADLLNVSVGQLTDALIEDLGFSNGMIDLDLGNQTVVLSVAKNLQFVITKSDGNTSKSLPKPSSELTTAEQKQCKDTFTQLKKSLKEMVTLQTNRLEEAFTTWRLWEQATWRTLFMDHPVMTRLAENLVWGVYSEDTLQQSFTVSDGKLVGENNTAIELLDGHTIGLVHRYCLTKAQTLFWNEFASNEGVEWLFNQLARDIVPLTGDRLHYQVSGFEKKNPATLISRLRKRGWRIGSVRDGGSFNELYKELPQQGFGIEITLDEDPYFSEYGFESDNGDVGIEKVQFYRLNELTRGSYVYDELEDEKHRHLLIATETLPNRITNELLYEMKQALV